MGKSQKERIWESESREILIAPCKSSFGETVGRELRQRLSPLELRVYRLRMIKRWTYEEIGERLVRSPDTCRMAAERARTKIRKIELFFRRRYSL